MKWCEALRAILSVLEPIGWYGCSWMKESAELRSGQKASYRPGAAGPRARPPARPPQCLGIDEGLEKQQQQRRDAEDALVKDLSARSLLRQRKPLPDEFMPNTVSLNKAQPSMQGSMRTRLWPTSSTMRLSRKPAAF